MSLRLESDTLDVRWLSAPGLNSPLSSNFKRQLCSICCKTAHRLKFCPFYFEFTSFTSPSPSRCIFIFYPSILFQPCCLQAAGRAVLLGCSTTNSIFGRVRGEQLDLMGQSKWAPPFSGGEAMDPSIRRWPQLRTTPAPAWASHGSAWDWLLIKVGSPAQD